MACSYCICCAGIVKQASVREVEPLVLFDIFSKSHSYGKLVCLAAVKEASVILPSNILGSFHRIVQVSTLEFCYVVLKCNIRGYQILPVIDKHQA